MARTPEDGVAPTLVEDLLEEVDQWQRFQAALPPATLRIERTVRLPAVRARRGSLHQALLAVVTHVKEGMAGPAAAEIRIVAGAEGGRVRLRVEPSGSVPGPNHRAGRIASGPASGDFSAAAFDLAVAQYLFERDGGTMSAARGGDGAAIVVELAAWPARSRD